ncbi:alternative ribosome-rescue factor A [Vibrio mangrovi]|uniref:Alternative ribosome-rescue factor A n=1 Tax=Vibrio mangrovi TaxID=474394 RepID=A0A1Y6IYA4_9VIBR|nr:ribosome alternative rescue factor ArfA [Vibrio mangrovi]MDW6005146.1 ribosome alternative rescue factor ArfA [Vibrio mangrovi]SMS02644.1 Alternative ribosome-rescue factor A [Vibrio mangrovi]
MKKEKRQSVSGDVEIQRGTVTDNALKALVTSPVFKMRVEKPKKGKGSFQRKAKHQGQESYPKAA